MLSKIVTRFKLKWNHATPFLTVRLQGAYFTLSCYIFLYLFDVMFPFSFRDFVVYATSGVSKNLEGLTHVLSETVLRPKITKEEVDMAARAIGFELAGLQMAPPVDPILTELLHAAAYHADNTLGLARYCPAEVIEQIGRREIMQFMASYFK